MAEKMFGELVQEEVTVSVLAASLPADKWAEMRRWLAEMRENFDDEAAAADADHIAQEERCYGRVGMCDETLAYMDRLDKVSAGG